MIAAAYVGEAETRQRRLLADGSDPATRLDEATAAARQQRLALLRGDFYRCLTRRADALFELTDAVLCATA